MKRLIFIFIFLSISGYSQSKIDKLMNQVANDLIPKNFNYYNLLENSLQDEKANDSINISSPKTKREFLESYPNFPFELGLKVKSEKINWKNYNLEKAKYITEEQAKKITGIITEVYFVDENIEIEKYDYLNENKDFNELIVKKNKKWTDEEIRTVIVKSLKEDAELQKENKVYFVFSNPIFSNDNEYARVSVLSNRRCKGECITYIYHYKNEVWTQIAEYAIYTLERFNCEDLITIFKN